MSAKIMKLSDNLMGILYKIDHAIYKIGDKIF